MRRKEQSIAVRLIYLGMLVFVVLGCITFLANDQTGSPLSTPETSQTPRREESRYTLGLSPGNSESLRLDHSFAPLEIPVPIDMRKSYAREKRLPVLDSESLDLDSSLIELLELTPTQVAAINDSLRSFMQSLRTHELSHAFVSVDPSGNEEIIVSAFDRGPLIKQLQAEISAKGIPDIADFLVGQLPFDSTLAVADAEMRVAMETGEDGAERVSFTRRLRRSDAMDDTTPIVSRGGIFGNVSVRFSPTDLVTSQGLLEKGISPRLRHLFTAAPSLPRSAALP